MDRVSEVKLKPYYQDKWVTIYHGDCREILPELPKVDLVLTDPPYGIGIDYGSFVDSPDNVKELVSEVIPMCIEKAERVALTCGTRQLWFYPPASWVLCWFNRAGTGMNPWGFTCWQPILVYGKDPYLENRMGSRPDYIEFSEPASTKKHPCAKPIKFWKMLLARVSVNVSDVVLDPFLGSGTTVEACKALNRRCIGIEIEEKYCEIAAKRCSQGVFDFREDKDA